MKLFSTIIILIFSIQAFSQSFELPKPNVDELKSEIENSGNGFGVAYFYLIKNFDSISSKKEIKHFDYEVTKICSFNQNFEKGINYSLEKCTEAGGISISITLPKTKRQSVEQWIEQIFKTDSMDIEHGWNKNKTKFEPTDGGAGCYFEIKETKTNTIIKSFCGC